MAMLYMIVVAFIHSSKSPHSLRIDGSAIVSPSPINVLRAREPSSALTYTLRTANSATARL